MRLLHLHLVCFLFVFNALPTYATVITTQFTGTVTSTVNNNTASGTEFRVFATYENTSTRVNTFNDGTNGIAEFGLGDDINQDTLCGLSDTDPSSCTNPPRLNVAFIAPLITFDISELLALLDDTSIPFTNFNDNRNNNQAIATGFVDGTLQLSIVADHLSILLNNNVATNAQQAFLTASSPAISTLFYTTTRTDFVSIPEPTSIVIIILGLLAMSRIISHTHFNKFNITR